MPRLKRKSLEQITAPLPKHKHCAICGAPITMSKRFCSIECEEAEKKMSRRRTYTMVITMMMFPVVLIVMMLLTP